MKIHGTCLPSCQTVADVVLFIPTKIYRVAVAILSCLTSSSQVRNLEQCNLISKNFQRELSHFPEKTRKKILQVYNDSKMDYLTSGISTYSVDEHRKLLAEKTIGKTKHKAIMLLFSNALIDKKVYNLPPIELAPQRIIFEKGKEKTFPWREKKALSRFKHQLNRYKGGIYKDSLETTLVREIFQDALDELTGEDPRVNLNIYEL